MHNGTLLVPWEKSGGCKREKDDPKIEIRLMLYIANLHLALLLPARSGRLYDPIHITYPACQPYRFASTAGHIPGSNRQ